MRINRLDLIRYGRFTDATLDLGPKVAGKPDLHIVYGPNEAGKTTIFNGVLDLIFGIETRSRYGFRHGYDQMRIGGSLEIDGRERVYQRVKQRQNSLLDAAGAAVGDQALAGALGGLSRDTCRIMFSLDDETLEQGGDSILASKGELGQLLFSASAGLAGMSRRLEAIEEELAQFHRPQGRATGLAEGRRRLAEIAERRKAVDMLAGSHGRLVEERTRAEAAYEDAGKRLAALVARRAEVAAILQAQPLVRERAGLVIDDDAIAAEPVVLALAAVEPVYREQKKDFPNRQAEADESDRDVGRLLDALGRGLEPEPRRLLLDAPEVAALKELAGARGALDARFTAGREALSQAIKALDDASLEQSDPSSDDGTLQRLSAVLAAVRAERSTGRLRESERRTNEKALLRDRALAALRPWTGDAESLAALVAPSQNDLATIASRIQNAEKALQLSKAAADKATADLQRRRAERIALGEIAPAQASSDPTETRAERERLWEAHRRDLSAESADAFAAAMRRDDAAVLAQLSQASSAARFFEARSAEALATAEVEFSAKAAAEAATEAAAARETLARLILSVSAALPQDMSAEAFRDWLGRRVEALAAIHDHRVAADENAEARKELLALRAELASTLAASGVAADETATLSTLEQLADGALQKASALQERALARRKLERALKDRQVAVDDDEARIAAWDTAWSDALTRTWLGTLSPSLAPTAVLTMLDKLAELRAALDRRSERHDRLAKLERNMREFEAAVIEAGHPLGMGGAGSDPLAVFMALIDRIKGARATVTRLSAIDANLALIAAEYPGLAITEGDRLTLETELQRIDAELETIRDAERRAFHERENAATALAAVGADSKAALVEAERATALTVLRAESERWLRLTLGARAVREAIRIYRDAHRSSMLETASNAFRLISQQAYRGLSAHAVDGVEQLVAIAADGSSKPVTELALSKGTRFQLYLALRVAGHREFARERTPPPFILDDIMETFDDFRAEEAFRVLGGMAEIGQVIYLTHHRHLLPIAMEACPGARQHEIPA